MSARLLLAVLSLAVAQDAPLLPAPTNATWSYVVPREGEAQRHPQRIALRLRDELPAELRLDLDFPGATIQFAQLRFGDPDSVRLALALVRAPGREPALYVDADRGRVLDQDDLVPRASGLWIATLPVSVVRDGRAAFLSRRVVFRLGLSGVFSYATMGYLEGAVEVGGRALRARRVDGDGNGFFSDARDHLWLDLDGDGEWQALGELFLCAPTLDLDGERHALRSDRLGQRLELERVDDFGRLRVALAPLPGQAARVIRSADVLLVGKDGSAIGVRTLGEPIEVPVGEYRVGMVSLSVVDPGGGADWSFVFFDSGEREGVHWYEVTKDSEVTIDPVGRLSLGSRRSMDGRSGEPGEAFTVVPRLYTEDGLVINLAARGRVGWSSRSTGAVVELLSPSGDLLDSAASGFS